MKRGRALPSQDIFDEAMAFLDACEPKHLQNLNMRTRQLQASGHGATEHGRGVTIIASQHPGVATPPGNLSNVSLQLETRGQFQPQSLQALLGTSMHVYQYSGTLQSRPHCETNVMVSAAGASAGQMTQINQPYIPAAAGGIAGEEAPRVPRKRATLDPETVLQIFFTRDNPSSCYAWATELGVTSKAVRDVWNLRTWRQ